jgi:hypothetical protein
MMRLRVDQSGDGGGHQIRQGTGLWRCHPDGFRPESSDNALRGYRLANSFLNGRSVLSLPERWP